MNKIHEKSPCCDAQIRLFGARRRQCILCKKTWRVWKKKRGRKQTRLNMKSLFSYFDGKLHSKFKKGAFSARLRSLLHKFNCEEPWPEVPTGPLIVIADALIQFFNGEKYTVYFILVRRVDDLQAFILPPYMRAGGEVVLGWQEAFENIPRDIFDRIGALVCDGHTGLVYLAKRHNWLLQRCQFHLLANLEHFTSCSPLNQTYGLGIRIKNLVRVVLYHTDMTAVHLALDALWKIKNTTKSDHLKSVVSGFVKHFEDFRTYINYPQYFLPTTSNSAEFLNSLIRNLQYRAKGFRTPQSFFTWITGLCKYKRSVTCRGKNQPN